MITIQIFDREYSNWTTEPATTQQLCPLNNKLFSGDVFSLDEESQELKIIQSPVRNNPNIAGVLLVKNNKTFGRSANGKLLYKCIPDNPNLPHFLVPYEMKHMGFSKAFQNQYITFQYKDWHKSDKHPCGTISQLIGSVDALENFYEYQLYCKKLNTSIQKFNKDTSKALQQNPSIIETIYAKYPNIEDRILTKVFSIDPENSVDFDDAFSIQHINTDLVQLSIYISNVSLWLEELNLWDSFTQRVSTIYLPDKKRTMLPSILSDSLCSLQSNNIRFALVMDIFIDIATKEIKEFKYSNCKIKVYKNYVYEEPNLIADENYKLLQSVIPILLNTTQCRNDKNSHDNVADLMIFMNHHVAKEFIKCENSGGIFRSSIIVANAQQQPQNLMPPNLMTAWNNSIAQYITLNDAITKNISIAHEHMDMDVYVHITSPIRRLVDLLNIIKFQEMKGLIILSEKATQFYEKWNMDYINTTMRKIRRVQNDCNLLHLCNTSTDTLNKIYDGYIFLEDTNIVDSNAFSYSVYLPDLRITSKIILREKLDNYSKHQFKLYLFYNEEKFKKKIRLQLVDVE